MGEKDDFDLGILVERVSNIENQQNEQKVALEKYIEQQRQQNEKFKDQIKELEKSDDKTKIYVAQIHTDLAAIKAMLQQKSKTWKELIYILLTGALTGITTYYATLASYSHQFIK